VGANNCVHDSPTDLIVNWLLLVAGSSDEELVFYVYEILRMLDQVFVGGLYAVFLGQDSVTPVGGRTYDLDLAWAPVFERERTLGVKWVFDVPANWEGWALYAG
jgi:hypothetical protein